MYLRQNAALVRDSLQEALARWVFWAYYGLSTLAVLFFLFLLRIDVIEGARATITLLGDTSARSFPVRQIVQQAYGAVAILLYVHGMALAVFAASGLMAAPLEAGRIEWLLSKPIARAQILTMRFLAGLMLVALNASYLVLAVWTILGWKTGVWDPAFMIAILTVVFMFAVLLSAVTLTVVITGNATVGTMVAFALMLISPILAQHKLMVKLLDSEAWRTAWRTLHQVLPKVYEVGKMNMDLLRGRTVESWAPVWSSAAFAAVMLAVALYIFSKRDF